MPSEAGVHFFYEDLIDFLLPEPEQIKRWIFQIIETEGFGIAQLNYIFCDDEYLHKINVEYLQHDTFTDIITFDNSEKEGQIEGDIFISVERVRDNSLSHNTTFFNELLRVIAHGALHLIGYNDKTDEEKQAMRKKEEACLSLYPN